MRHFPKWIILVVIGFVCVMVVFAFGFQQYKNHDLRKTMNEAANIAANQSLDKSVRVDPGQVVITPETFEQVFKAQMQKVNIKASIKKYQFDYLTTDDGTTKAIIITIIDDDNTPYSVTYISDVNNN